VSSSHYSFGDNERAALRLDYLAAAFAPSSRSFLQSLTACSWRWIWAAGRCVMAQVYIER